MVALVCWVETEENRASVEKPLPEATLDIAGPEFGLNGCPGCPFCCCGCCCCCCCICRSCCCLLIASSIRVGIFGTGGGGEVRIETDSSIRSVAQQGVSWAQESWFSAGRMPDEEEQAYYSRSSGGKVGVAIVVVAIAVVGRTASLRLAVGWD